MDSQRFETLWTLVCQDQDGNQTAFGEIYAHFRPKIYGPIYSKTLNHEDTEDFVSAAFVAVYVRRPKCDHPAQFMTYLMTVANRRVADALRSNAQRRKRESSQSRESGPEPYEELMRSETRNKVDRVLQRLNESDRRIIILRFWEDKGYKEIAEILEIEPGAARQRVFRALRALRDLLGREVDLKVD